MARCPLPWLHTSLTTLVLLAQLFYLALAAPDVTQAAPCLGFVPTGLPDVPRAGERSNPGVASAPPVVTVPLPVIPTGIGRGSDAGETVTTSVTLPTDLPNAGHGGGVSYCEEYPNDPTCSRGSQASTVGGGQGDVIITHLPLAGSSPGHHGPGLLMVALSAQRYQADPCTSASTPLPCPDVAAPPLPDPRDVALGISLPFPHPTIKITPDVGLVALKEWYRLEGYNGEPVTASTHIHEDGASGPPGCPGGPGADMDVTVQAMPTEYVWTFGDDTPEVTTTSLGRSYPEEDGSIHHAYRWPSGKFPDGYSITVTAHWQVQYRANGGAWQALPAVDRTSTGIHKVQQAVPVLVHNQNP